MSKKKEILNPKASWYSKSIDYAFKKVNSSEHGLSRLEAEERLKQNGENTLPQKKPKIK